MASMRRVTRKPPKDVDPGHKDRKRGKQDHQEAARTDLHQRTQNDDRRDRVGDRHKRRVQRCAKRSRSPGSQRNTTDANTMKCCIKLAGANRPTPNSTNAPPAARSVTCCLVCSLKAATSCARFSSGVSSLGASGFFCAAIACTLGGGGGKVISLFERSRSRRGSRHLPCRG